MTPKRNPTLLSVTPRVPADDPALDDHSSTFCSIDLPVQFSSIFKTKSLYSEFICFKDKILNPNGHPANPPFLNSFHFTAFLFLNMISISVWEGLCICVFLSLEAACFSVRFKSEALSLERLIMIHSSKVLLVQFSSVTQSTLCDPMNCSTPGLPVHRLPFCTFSCCPVWFYLQYLSSCEMTDYLLFELSN